MPITWELQAGQLGVLRVSGKLSIADLKQAQNECEAAIRELGGLKILAILVDFDGWERAEGWEDMSFAERNDPYIDKFAIVGDDQWRDLVYAFTGRGFRPVPIEYFTADQEAAARQWLSS